MINSTLNLALIATVTTSAIPAGKQKENAQKQPNPNVLFIAVDDLKPILGCYNDQLIKTPHIDRLAAMGTVFKNAYCQQAISGATRSSLLTGFRPDRTQVYDLVTQIRDMNPDVTTLPEHFKKEGYTTSAIGKIFHPSNVVNEDGERSWSIPHSEGESYYAKEYGLPALGHWQAPDTKKEINKCIAEAKEKGIKENLSKYVFQYIKPSVECIDVPDNAYADGALTMEAQERLKSLTKTGKPFFLAVGYHKPHLPFVAPKKYWDLYDREQLPLAEFQEQAQGSLSVAYHNCGELKNYTDIPACCKFTERDTPRIGLSVEKQKELIHGYYGAAA